jgi:hypothetical protein
MRPWPLSRTETVLIILATMFFTPLATVLIHLVLKSFDLEKSRTVARIGMYYIQGLFILLTVILLIFFLGPYVRSLFG